MDLLKNIAMRLVVRRIIIVKSVIFFTVPSVVDHHRRLKANYKTML